MDEKLHTSCKVIAKYLLPIYRSLIAKDLIEKYNFTQIEAAESLGTTQAAISQYIHSKRGLKGAGEFEDILPLIQVAAAETAKKIASGEFNAEEVTQFFCSLCSSIRESLKNIKKQKN